MMTMKISNFLMIYGFLMRNKVGKNFMPPIQLLVDGHIVVG